jgi:hypothetical protein
MRSTLALAGIVLLLASRPGAAQTAPGEMVVLPADVEVRTGPAAKFNATGKLRQGERVVVVPDSKLQPGWQAIKPPADSLSWIEAKHVKKLDENPHIATVIADEVPVRPGVRGTNRPLDVEWIKVKRGLLVVIAGPEAATDNGTWLPIQPPPQDVRYVPAEALGTAPVFATVPNNVPPATLIAQADQAVHLGQFDRAKQLYQQALDRTSDYLERIRCQNALTSMDRPGAGSQVASGNAGTSGQMTSLYRTNPNNAPSAALNYPAQWSKWGQLRSTKYDQIGQPVFVLETRKGDVLLYVTTQPGFSLRDYIGKTVALYGPMVYPSNENVRVPHMTASHVATVP